MAKDNNRIIGGAYIVNDPSPGGLFNNGAGTNPQNYTASRAASVALSAADDSKGWAVGDTDTDTGGWTATNNSKYWAQQAMNVVVDIDSDIARAEAAAEAAAESAAGADASADDAAQSATEASGYNEAARGEAELASAWAVGPNPPADIDTPNDMNNAYYWSTVAEDRHSDANIFAQVARSWAVGDTEVVDPNNITLGNDTDNARYWAEQNQLAVATVEAARDQAQAAATSADSDATNAAQSAALASGSAAAAEAAAANAAGSATQAAASAASADSDRILAQTAAAEAVTDAQNAATSATEAQGYSNTAMQWAIDTDIDTFPEGSAKYWAGQAQDSVGRVAPENLIDSDEFYYQPVVTDTDTQGVTMAVGVRRRWNAETGEVETAFRSLDKAHRITAGGEHDTYHGRNELGHDVEARHSWNMHVDSDIAQDIFLFSEEHGGFSHLKPTDPTVQVDLDSEGTHTNLTIYNLSTQLINNEVIDTDTIATRTWVEMHTGGAGGYRGRIDTDFLDTDSGNLALDTDKVAPWIRSNQNIQVTGTPTVVQFQNQFANVADPNAVMHFTAGEGILYSSDISTTTMDIRVDTNVIADSDWVIEYVQAHGGGGESDNLTLTASPATTNYTQQDTEVTITLSVGVTSGTLKAGTTAGTAKDQNSHNAAVTKVNDTEFTFVLNRNTIGSARVTITGTITDAANEDHIHSKTFSVTVSGEWFTVRSTTAPTDTSSMTSEGGFNASGDAFTTAAGTGDIYVAIPATNTVYDIKDEFAFLNTTRTANAFANHDLYHVTEEVEANIRLTLDVEA